MYVCGCKSLTFREAETRQGPTGGESRLFVTILNVQCETDLHEAVNATQKQPGAAKC